jgi:Tfp pilus assembly PilM family ATPase
MPDVLAIHWDKRRLRIVEASIGSSIRIIQSFLVDVPETPSTRWLREPLKQHGVNARQAIVCLPREEAILRQLELPDAPDDELPTLVHFQASARSTTPLDQLVLDYVPLPRRTGATQRDVILASVPRATVDPIRSVLLEAGLDLVSLSLSSFALAELALRVDDQARGKSRLIVLADSNRLEVVALGEREPLAAHLVRPPLDDAGKPAIAKAAADISRVLVPTQPWLSDNPIQQIWVLGDAAEWDGLDQALRDRWNCPVERFDSHTSSQVRDLDLSKLSGPFAQYATAVGLALGRLSPRSPAFDLLHPRQPKPKRDPRKLQLAVGSAAALIVVAFSTFVYQSMMSSLLDKISKAQDELRELAGKSKAGDPERKAAIQIGEWKARDVNQLDEFVELYDLMQGTGRLYLSEYHFTPTTAGEVIAKLNAAGNAKERIDWQQLAQRLADAGRYRVNPKEVTQVSRDSDYPNRFEVVTDLIPPGKPAAGATSKETPSPKDK